jgi:hypothetical protein
MVCWMHKLQLCRGMDIIINYIINITSPDGSRDRSRRIGKILKNTADLVV